KDKYYGLRVKAVRALNMTNDDIHNAALPVLTSLAQSDENTLVRAAALSALAKLKVQGNMDMFIQALKSESYAVQGAALNGISQLDPAQALQLAKGFESDNRDALTQAIVSVYSESGSSAQWPFVYKQFTDADVNTKFGLIRNLAKMTGHVDNPAYAQQGIEEIKNLGIKYKIFNGVGPFVVGLLNNIKDQRIKLKDDASAKAAEDAAKAVTDAKGKDVQ
ncbi:MAG: pepN 1, partial [Mucilaginibacter sp.]|nr:pepN 1 [Mucilaginibacter sp.]